MCSLLQIEDYLVQPAPFISPIKWHLGHTSWFFEEFILTKLPEYNRYNARFNFLFNSYYESKALGGKATNRSFSRPSLVAIQGYREHVNAAVKQHLPRIIEKYLYSFELGLLHEEQHQELMLTGIKYLLGHNLFRPDYATLEIKPTVQPQPSGVKPWCIVKPGIHQIGRSKTKSLGFDHEYPRHARFIHGAKVSRYNVTNGEYLEFIEDGGYQNPLLWLSDGWTWRKEQNIQHPLYWQQEKDGLYEYTLTGYHPLNPKRVLMHVSYYEAAAYAKWRKLRLPTEFELEITYPELARGIVWDWTSSPYLAYPGYVEPNDETTEYNAKFMVNRYVLRGGCLATPQDHVSTTYRNFYRPADRHHFAGIRLASDG